MFLHVATSIIALWRLYKLYHVFVKHNSIINAVEALFPHHWVDSIRPKLMTKGIASCFYQARGK